MPLGTPACTDQAGLFLENKCQISSEEWNPMQPKNSATKNGQQETQAGVPLQSPAHSQPPREPRSICRTSRPVAAAPPLARTTAPSPDRGPQDRVPAMQGRRKQPARRMPPAPPAPILFAQKSWSSIIIWWILLLPSAPWWGNQLTNGTFRL